MKKTCIFLLIIFVICGCRSSFNFRQNVNKEINEGNYSSATAKIEDQKNKIYREKDSLIYYLDLGTVQHDAKKHEESDKNFDLAQQRIDELFATSVSQSVGTLVKNELTAAYEGADYERAMTYFYRAMNFLAMNNLSGALVEARKAVFYLDNLRKNKHKGYNDDPFVQYFASLLFESEGNLSSARIARANAFNAYERFASFYNVPKPEFAVPSNADKMGEIVFVHYNGHIPIIRSQTIQIAWDRAMSMTIGTDDLANADSSVQNAVVAGIMGNAVTIAYPVLTPVPFSTAGSSVRVGSVTQDTVLVHNLSALAKEELDERMPSIMAKMVARAVIKQIIATQARHAATKATDNENWGMVAGMMVSAFNAATERADTRMWFTLPGEIRMSRIFVEPGYHKIVFTAYDSMGNAIEVKDFDNIEIKAGERIYLHHRTGK